MRRMYSYQPVDLNHMFICWRNLRNVNEELSSFLDPRRFCACSQWMQSDVATEADRGEQCSGVWRQGDHRDCRIIWTHFTINGQYGVLYLSCYIYSCNYSACNEIYLAASQLRSFGAGISLLRPDGSIPCRSPYGICGEPCGNGTGFAPNRMLHIHSSITDAI
jgi:hypothetical protein